MAKNLVNKSAAGAKKPAKAKGKTAAAKSKAQPKEAPTAIASGESSTVLAGHQVTQLVEKAMIKDTAACMKLLPGVSFDDVKNVLHAKVQAGLISPDQLPG